MLLLAGTFVMLVAVSRADEAQPEVLPAPREVPAQDVLPQPRVLPMPELPYYVVDPPPQFGRRSVWQMMSPNYMGQMRPSVVVSPNGGGYYLYNGAPYPWINTHPTWLRGYLLD